MDNKVTMGELKLALAIFRALTPEHQDQLLALAKAIQQSQAADAGLKASGSNTQ